MPYGSEVTGARFNLVGDASQTTYTNFTTDRHFGGAGSGSWSGSPPSPYTSGSRSNVHVENTDVTLRPQPTTTSGSLTSSSALSSVGTATHNTTGGFVSLGDQGYTGVLTRFSSISAPSTTAWSYAGVNIVVEDEIHQFRYTSSSLYNVPTIQRFNATTGDYIGTASMSTGTCSSTSVRYNIYDATMDSGGKVWLAHYSSYLLSKWTVSETSWSCTSSYNFGYPYYITGVDFDEGTNKLWATYYDSSSYPVYNQYLMELNPASPTSINGTWSLGSSSDFNHNGASNNPLSGLDVNHPRVTVNEYNVQGSRHHHYSFTGSLLAKEGYQTMPGGGHYGLAEYDEGKVMWTCYHVSYCSGYARQFQVAGDGALYDERSPSGTSATVQGATTTISSAVSSLKLAGVFAFVPSGTSVSVQVSNDGGTTWLSATPGQTVNFASAGTQITWRATLSGTAQDTPILDGVVVEYVNQYVRNGYIYGYQYTGGTTNVVAATVHWNATTPTGTSVKVNLATGSSSTSCTSGSLNVQQFTQSGQSKSFTSTSYYQCFRIELASTSVLRSPTLEDVHIQFHSNVPENVELKVAGTEVWDRQGTLFGAATAQSQDSGSRFLKGFNDNIPSTGSGYVDLEVTLTSSKPGKLILSSFEVTYTCLLYTSPSPRDRTRSRMPSSA